MARQLAVLGYLASVGTTETTLGTAGTGERWALVVHLANLLSAQVKATVVVKSGGSTIYTLCYQSPIAVGGIVQIGVVLSAGQSIAVSADQAAALSAAAWGVKEV